MSDKNIVELDRLSRQDITITFPKDGSVILSGKKVVPSAWQNLGLHAYRIIPKESNGRIEFLSNADNHSETGYKPFDREPAKTVMLRKENNQIVIPATQASTPFYMSDAANGDLRVTLGYDGYNKISNVTLDKLRDEQVIEQIIYSRSSGMIEHEMQLPYKQVGKAGPYPLQDHIPPPAKTVLQGSKELKPGPEILDRINETWNNLWTPSADDKNPQLFPKIPFLPDVKIDTNQPFSKPANDPYYPFMALDREGLRNQLSNLKDWWNDSQCTTTFSSEQPIEPYPCNKAMKILETIRALRN